jgi:hypothetical protein
MNFRLVSPNIDMRGGTMLELWKKAILKHKAVFMGWSPKRTADGQQRLGQMFAGRVEGGVSSRDLIVSGYREDGVWHLVACGRVDSEARDDGLDDLRDYLNFTTYRKLKPFAPLRDAPESLGFSFGGTTADGQDPNHPRRVIPALVKFHPQTNDADKSLRDKLMKALDLTPEPLTLTSPLAEDRYLRVSPSQRKIIVPRHNRLSNAFVIWLRKRGYHNVRQEEGHADVDFIDGTTTCRAELKVCYGVKTRQAIREALGQLLEYNYYPYTRRELAEKWFLVLDKQPSEADILFLRRLRMSMKFPLSVCSRRGNSFEMKRC